MGELIRRLRYLLHRRRFDAELRSDMEFHREMAAREGRSNFGNSLRLREDAREAWGWMWLDRLGQDLRYAVRMLARSPGFTVAAVLMLAIGIGVNVAAFSFFNLMVLSPLPVREPASLQRFHRRSPDAYAFALPYPEMAFFRQNSRTLSTVLALNFTRVAIAGEEKPLNGHFVTTNFFTDLGGSPRLGRVLDPVTDEAADAPPVVVLGHGFWQRHFGGDSGVVGRQILLNGKPVTVVGVAGKEFSGLSLDRPDFWAPLAQQPYLVTGSHLLTDYSVENSGVQMFGRLQPGLSPRAAEEELRGLAAELRKSQPAHIWEKETLPSQPGGYATSLMIGNRSGTGSEQDGELAPVAAMVVALCLLILSVACANLGSLLLARGVAREREISIRISVGAGRVRLLRQLFTESLVLSLLGAAAGLGAGYAVLRGLMALSAQTPEWFSPMPDWRVVVFTLGIAFFAALLFGLAPALQTVRRRHQTTFLRQILVGAQIAASCVLLIVAGLLVRALEHALFTNPGYEYQQVVTIDPGLAAHGYTPARARGYLDALQGRLRAVPGVTAVSLTDTPPLGNRASTAGVGIDGRSAEILLTHADPQYLATMKIPLLQGRGLERGDIRAIVISQSMAARFWPGTNPLGKQFPVDGANSTVVGVSADAHLMKMENGELVQLYGPLPESGLPSVAVVVRTSGPGEDLARTAIAISRSLDPAVFPTVQMLKNAFRSQLLPAQSSALVASLLGFVAQLLACVGIIGVVSYAVSQRVREIGIRMALGARPIQVVSVVLRQFLWPVVAGLVAGTAGAVLLSRLMRGVLYGISNLDPVAYGMALFFFLATVVLAAMLPARGAVRVDPMRALRQD